MKAAYPSLSECYVGPRTVEVLVGLGWSWGNRVVGRDGHQGSQSALYLGRW